MSKIAIIGMSCLLPGASAPSKFWQNLVEGKNTQTEATEADLGIPLSECYRTAPEPNKIYNLKGGFIRDFCFDSSGYSSPKEQLDKLDDVFQWSLHVTREALTDAGMWQSDKDLVKTGVILGNYTFPTKLSNELVLPSWRKQLKEKLSEQLGSELSFVEDAVVGEHIANRNVCGYPTSVVADACNMKGPQFAIDAACASALYAIKLAAYYLESGRADVMVAGGVCAPDAWLIHTSFSDLKAYSPNNSSIPFDKDSTGIQTSQGAGAVVLKRLEDAINDGDEIYCVIEACGLSNDGAGKHLLSPNPDGQILAYQRAFQATELTPDDIDYIECHATGTPLGDQTELNSLEAFFGDKIKNIKLGSVKGNTGHLLTVAGLTSLMKLILSLQHQQLVATLNLNKPRQSQHELVTANNIVTSNQPWPTKKQAGKKQSRIAGVSAFGFGGTNVHLLISDDIKQKYNSKLIPSVPAAIVGMGAHFGKITSLTQFEDAIFNNKSHYSKEEQVKAKGFNTDSKIACVDDIEISPLELKIPPTELKQFNHQQLLMLKVAQETLYDAGFNLNDCIKERRNIAVIIVMELDLKIHLRRAKAELPQFLESLLAQSGLSKEEVDFDYLLQACSESVLNDLNANEVLSYIGNIMASKISSIWNFSGASFTLSGDGSGVTNALDIGQLMLSAGDVEGVLVGAVDMLCKVEELDAMGDNKMPWQSDNDTLQIGEGAGCVLLMRDEYARQHKLKRYATLKEQVHHNNAHEEIAIADKLRDLVARQSLDKAQIGLIDLTAFAEPELALSEFNCMQHLAQETALSNTSSTFGYTRVAAPIASLIKTSLSLYHRYLPATKEWPKAQQSIFEQWQGNEFYCPVETYPWLKSQNKPRHAVISSIAPNGSFFVTLLEEAGWSDEHQSNTRQLTVFPLIAEHEAGLNVLINQYAKITNTDDFNQARIQAIKQLKQAPRNYKVMMLVVNNVKEFISELALASKHLNSMPETNWKTPKGSFYAAQAMPENSKVSLVYPGGFNSYPMLAKGLFRLVPSLLRKLDDDMDDGSTAMAANWLYPKSLTPISINELIKREQEMLQDIPAMLSSGTSLSILYTQLIKDCLKVKPSFAFGYSLGETSMLFANNIWPTKGRNSESLRASPLFKDVLTGNKNLIREVWDISADVANKDVWQSVAALGDIRGLSGKVNQYDKVYITHINSHNEAILAGQPDALTSLCAELDMDFVKMPVAHVLHCEVMRACELPLADLNRYEAMAPEDGMQFISASTYDVIANYESDALAAANGDSLCRMVDFPALMEKSYSLGSRFFIEVGPGGTCSRWLKEHFNDRDVAVASVVQRGHSDLRSFTQLAVQLISYRVPLDLDWLFADFDQVNTASRSTKVNINIADWRFANDLALEKVNTVSKIHPNKSPAYTAATEPSVVEEPTMLADKVTNTNITEINVAADKIAKTKIASNTEHQLKKAAPISEIVSTTLEENKMDNFNYDSDIDFGQGKKDRDYLQAIEGAHLKYLQMQTQLQNKVFDTIKQVINGDSLIVDDMPLEASSHLSDSSLALSNVPRLNVITSSQSSANDRDSLKIAPVEKLAKNVTVDGCMDEHQLMAFANGKIADAFGSEYSEIDQYPVRVRLPAPPYFFVSRVTQIKAERGKFEPCMLTTEYDIPEDAWYLTDGVMPPGVAVEAGQSDLLLISYLGIDFENKGKRVYRLLDGELVFLGDLPRAGQTLRFDIYIDSFVRQGEMLLFFFRYDGYVDGKLALKLNSGCAGFFTAEELSQGQGVIPGEKVTKTRLVKPILKTAKRSLDHRDLLLLSQGDINSVFGHGFKSTPATDGLRLPPETLLMVDKVSLPDLSQNDDVILLEAFKTLDPNGWYFNSHFVDDPVLPGSLVAEGATQMLKVYLLGVGFSQCFAQGEFQPLSDAVMTIKVRGQITPDIRNLRYEVKIFESGFLPRPYVKANVTVFDGDRAMVQVDNLGLCVKEKLGHVPYPRYKEPGYHSGRELADGTEVILNEFHLAHASKGHLKTALGVDFGVYDNMRAPYFPNGDFQFVDRAVAITGDDGIDMVGAKLTTEYDSPANAWYYADNASPFMPNCVYLETALQASILLGYYRGATLTYPDKEFSIRNLEGHATYYQDIDLRGKTVRHQETLLSSTSLNGSVLQNYHFVLTADGEKIYEGESLFGFFTEEALKNQVGLDKGELSQFWYEQANVKLLPEMAFETKEQQELGNSNQPEHYRMATKKLNLLHHAHIIKEGGKYGKGYIHGYREIFADDWYFDCHFYKDPVMPGSLGIEAIIQALHGFVIENKIGLAKFKSPRFSLAPGIKTVWKYRGQILRTDSDMYIEAHVKSIEEHDDHIVLVADADLFKGRLRIYELQDLAIVIKEMDL